MGWRAAERSLLLPLHHAGLARSRLDLVVLRSGRLWSGRTLQGSRLCTFSPTRSAFEAGIKRETPKFITSPEFRISRNRPEVSTSIHGACGRKMRANRSEGFVAKRRYASIRFSCLDIASGSLIDLSWPFGPSVFPGLDWIAINYNLKSTNNSPQSASTLFRVNYLSTLPLHLFIYRLDSRAWARRVSNI